ncbi:MAG TPA: hypothetical protein VMI73_07295 [Trebonia sp.]|nr:hypothetical protein [Trebonia sp.]
MKPVKRSVALVVRGSLPEEFLIVRRPEDPDDPLAGLWGLPAITLLDGEDEVAAVSRAGRVKLGVELAVGARIGERSADRGGHVLRLADYEAVIVTGIPAVPQPDRSMTQYTACRFTSDTASLHEAAACGSLCAQVFLGTSGTVTDTRTTPEDNSKKRPEAANPANANLGDTPRDRR